MEQFRGGNMASVKLKNRAAILRAVRSSGGMSRVALARAMGLTKGGLTPLVEELLVIGLLREAESEPAASGRRPVRLAICPQRCYVAAVDWTRQHMRGALVDFGGNITRMRTAETGTADPAAALARLAELIREVRGETPVIGIAVTAPGPIDPQDGVILQPPNFGGLRDVPVARTLEAAFSLPVFLDNNAIAHTLAEKDYGYGREYESFLHLVVDEGIGGGVVSRGQLYRGMGGGGSEFGHITLDMDGPPCPCGNRGCAELYAAVPALLRKTGAAYPTWAAFMEGLRRRDAAVLAALGHEALALAGLLVSAVNLFMPQAVVLGSQIADAGEFLTEILRNELRRRCFHPAAGKIPVYCSGLRHPALLGGASLVFDAFLNGDLGTYEAVLAVDKLNTP